MQDEFKNYQQSVAKTGEDANTQAAGIGSNNNAGIIPSPPNAQGDDICEICHKTKFVDGIGHSCHYCAIRSCARCGRKVNLRSAKGSALVSNSDNFFIIYWIYRLLYMYLYSVF